MELNQQEAELFIPDGQEQDNALSRTTELCIAAHQDDIEIMAYGPIVSCYGREDKWFTGVVVTDGAGSPRSGVYADYTDEAMKKIRTREQIQAAAIGKYAAQFLLSYPSSHVKNAKNYDVVKELAGIIEMCNPEVIYTHNFADKHDTHVAVALRVIAAIRMLPKEKRPKKVYSLEVWRGLDWLCDEDKSVFDTSSHRNLAAALLGVYDSQIAGGKGYDLAVLGRRSANATFCADHATDDSDSISYGLDITPLIENDSLDVTDYTVNYISNFKREVVNRIASFE
jgi:LmbE family N-acetylglucosaminyl deacetylase